MATVSGSLSKSSTKFQSTPPIRVATIAVNQLWRKCQFQSTPPIRVATFLPTQNLLWNIHFNPRHPYGWRLDVHFLTSSAIWNFNPRHPYGWRPVCQISDKRMCLFQSTPPIRVATAQMALTAQAKLFQSTPPIRVATYAEVQTGVIDIISIHATHTGGDITEPATAEMLYNFNPRHPYGWRLACSIHRFFMQLFQSTPPIRVATFTAFRKICLIKYFNPRHPYGWRRCFVS